jgi:hypothetical protein
MLTSYLSNNATVPAISVPSNNNDNGTQSTFIRQEEKRTRDGRIVVNQSDSDSEDALQTKANNRRNKLEIFDQNRD